MIQEERQPGEEGVEGQAEEEVADEQHYEGGTHTYMHSTSACISE